MTPEDIEAIRIAIREEMLESPGISEPPPHDNEAERQVISDLLSGFIRTDELGGLQPKHFIHPMRREVYWYAKSNTPTIEATAAHLQARGFVGDIEAWVNAASLYPCRGKQSCHDAVRRILEAWRRRELLDFLGTIAAGLRCGSHTADEAIAALRAKVNPPDQARKSKLR